MELHSGGLRIQYGINIDLLYEVAQEMAPLNARVELYLDVGLDQCHISPTSQLSSKGF